MADENFFARWSRRKTEAAQGKPIAEQPLPDKPEPAPLALNDGEGSTPPPVLPPAEQVEEKPPLTMDDVAGLTPESDYSAFLARGVDEQVKRSALKKLFTDPHFNVMDGLDVYIEDYNKFEPIPAAMLATLNHAKSLLDPLANLEKPLMRVLEDQDERKPHDPQKVLDEHPEQLPAQLREESESARAGAGTEAAEDDEPRTDPDTAASEDPPPSSEGRPT